MPARLGAALAPVLVSALAAFAAAAGEIGDAELAALPEADVVFLGEVHDNPVHHANQAIAVTGMKPAALVFEMLTEEQALRFRPEMIGNPERLAQVLGWDASGWPDFALYYPIFVAGRGVPVFGGGIPRGEARRAIEEGVVAVMGDSARIFGLDVPLPPGEQATREAEQAAAHCGALPEELLPDMVAVQRLRDAALARAVIAAMAETGGPVAVITGNGHARTDRGAPAALGLAAPELDTLALGQLESRPGDGEEPPFDLWLVTAPHPRPDPCGEFR